MISDKKWVRHQRRCGIKNKKSTKPLVEHGATPDFYWGTYND
ncbi:MAG: hypothetical protein QXR69_01675 [Conexivisphaerales archaeon]